MLPIKEQLLFLKDWLGLDLNSAYITGSTLTHIIESKYRIPTWIPSDIDICCYNFTDEQYNHFTDVLKSKANRTIEHVNHQGFKNINYKINDFYHISTQRTGMSYKTRIQYTDYSVCSICSDGENIIVEDSTEYDIEHKILRWTGSFKGSTNIPRPGEDLERLLPRYFSYIKRGYVDKDNNILNSINEFMSKK